MKSPANCDTTMAAIQPPTIKVEEAERLKTTEGGLWATGMGDLVFVSLNTLARIAQCVQNSASTRIRLLRWISPLYYAAASEARAFDPRCSRKLQVPSYQVVERPHLTSTCIPPFSHPDRPTLRSQCPSISPGCGKKLVLRQTRRNSSDPWPRSCHREMAESLS